MIIDLYRILVSLIDRIVFNIEKLLPIWIIGSYYIALVCFAPSQMELFGLNLSLIDYFTILWIFFLLIVSKNSGLRINIRYLRLEWYLLIIFIFYAGIQTLHGIYNMYGIKSLSLYLQLLKNFLILCIVLYFLKQITIKEINRFIFKFGFFISLAMITLYVIFLKTGVVLINIFEYGEYKSIRFEGLAGDANFHAILMSLAFLIGFYSRSIDLNVKYKYVYLLPIGLNIVITVSRSVTVTLMLTFVISLFFFEKKILRKLKMFFLIFVSLSIFVYLSTIPLPGLGISIFEWYELRATQSSPRFEMWVELLKFFETQPYFGYGLRASEILLGGSGHYAHNSYLELLIDYGMFGFLIFVSFMLLVLFKGIKLVKINSSYKAWLQVYLMLMFLFGGFTFLYWGLLWLTISIILGGYNNEKNRSNHNIIQ